MVADSSSPIQSSNSHVHYTYGLHRRCSSISDSCTHFPQYEDCHGEDRYFCSMWRSIGFLMSFAVLLEGMILVAYTTVLVGGRQKRETGWKILSFLLVLAGVVQCASMALVVSDPNVLLAVCEYSNRALSQPCPHYCRHSSMTTTLGFL